MASKGKLRDLLTLFIPAPNDPGGSYRIEASHKDKESAFVHSQEKKGHSKPNYLKSKTLELFLSISSGFFHSLPNFFVLPILIFHKVHFMIFILKNRRVCDENRQRMFKLNVLCDSS